MIPYPTNLPCPDPATYSLSYAPAVRSSATLKGRSRFQLDDMHPTMSLAMSFGCSMAQMAIWQDFWRALKYGVDWFLMRLYVDGTEREVEVHATGAWSSTMLSGGRFTITMPVEVRVP